MEIARIKRLIRKGVLPRYAFEKDNKGKLERSPNKEGKMLLTWKIYDVLKRLTS